MKIPFTMVLRILCACCFLTGSALTAQTFTVLKTFSGADGHNPNAVIQGINGNIFGTTLSGGTGYNINGGYGTIFEITPSGNPVGMYRFCSVSKCADGFYPLAGLALGADGNLYGTTQSGGTSTNCTNREGCGTLFQVTLSSKLTTLYNFCALTACGDGQIPQETLVQGPNGSLFGTTWEGGSHNSSRCGAVGCGTVFEITPSGSLTTLHQFCQTDCSDGADPQSPLVVGLDGNLYGGSNASVNPMLGTLFVMTPTGGFDILHQFIGASGGDETVGMVAGNDGNIYGTNSSGGSYSKCSSSPCGTFFQLTPGGQYTTLYTFCSLANCVDGGGPWIGGIIQASDGNFYGTTVQGGTQTYSGLCNKCGVLYQITPAGKLTVLHNFCSQADCADGNGGGALMQGTDGKLYGTTPSGGLVGGCGGNGCGTIFSFDMGLSPFVKPNPWFGKTGYTISILGNNLTGTTGVSFNGTPATFIILSDTLVKATVPPGATNGTIQVTTASGTLSSVVAFQIRP